MQFSVLPNGMFSDLGKFTKLTKSTIACLRIEGIILVINIDDIIFIGETYEECPIGAIEILSCFENWFLFYIQEKCPFKTPKK